MTYLSIVLPVHNEKESLRPLAEECRQAVGAYPGAEIIAVDDGSTDGSLVELKSMLSDFPFLKVVELARNYGQTAAIAAGIDHAAGEIIVVMDADGQNDPADIPRLLKKIAEGYDIVSGWRVNRRDAWLRSLLSKFANWLIRMAAGQKINDYGCSLKAYRRSTIDEIGLYGDMHRFLPAYAMMHGARVAEIAVNHRPRLKGKSKYGFGRVWRVILDLFMLVFYLKSFTRPMQFFGGVGLVSTIVGMLTILAAFAWREAGGPTLIETPLPVLSALFIIVGVQCVLMGVLAEMSMRTYFQSQNKKTYLIRGIFHS